MLYILFICSIFLADFLALGNNDLQTKKSNQPIQKNVTDCNRIKVDTNKVTGARVFYTPTDNYRPFQSYSAPFLRFSKMIDSSGRERYSMGFKIYTNSHAQGNGDVSCRVIFRDGKLIEKHCEILYEMSPLNGGMIVNMPLDSADMVIIRNGAIKKITLEMFEITEIGKPEFYHYYLNCLAEKK